MWKKFFNKRRANKGIEIEDSIMTVMEEEKAVIEKPFQRRGASLMWYGIILTILILAGRVFYLDFFQGNHYQKIAKGNRIKSVIIKAPRGMILDKYGKVLATNIPSLDAIIIPSELPKNYQKRKKMAAKLSEILGMNSGNVEIIFSEENQKSLKPVLLKENIAQDQALIITAQANQFPGVFIDKTAMRSYNDGMIFSTFIGYDGKITNQELKNHPNYMMTDYIGKAGLEKSYEKELRGIYGAHQIEIDSLGNIQKNLGIINPIPGDDLILNIDEKLQKKIYDSLTNILKKSGTKIAAAVAIDPRNGGVLAMVSLPSYNNNWFARGITNQEYSSLITDKSLPLLNRCIAGEYPPGSTIKPGMAAAALSEGIITPSTIISGLGGMLRIGRYHFGDWRVHGPSDVRSAIAQSNDIFFYTVGGGYGKIQGLGMNKMKKYDNLFGFGQLTGIDIPGEAKGFIPDEKWKKEKFGERWYIGDSYHSVIGQGYITTTPLQLANYTATLANGGTLYSPKIVSRIRKSNGQEEIISPKILRSNFIKPNIMKVVREGMRMTVTEGTARSLQSVPVPVAGKTGTAQFGSQGKTHAWFISFAPYQHPVIAMAVLVAGVGEGASYSVPVTKEVYDWYFSSKNHQ